MIAMDQTEGNFQARVRGVFSDYLERGIDVGQGVVRNGEYPEPAMPNAVYQALEPPGISLFCLSHSKKGSEKEASTMTLLRSLDISRI